MLTLSSIVVASSDQVSRDLEGEVVILNLQTGTYFGLNGVGSRIWDLIQQPCAVSHVHDTLLKEYNVEPDACARDLLALLEQLTARGLIEVREPAS